MIRDQAVIVKDNNNNIIVENNVYSSTNDLWTLIEINSRSYLRIQMKEVKLKIMMTKNKSSIIYQILIPLTKNI